MTLPANEVKAELVKTTLALMDEGGIEAVKARPIAKTVGISVGSIYNMFGSIDGLIQEANAHILETFAAEVLKEIGSTDADREARLADGKITAEQALEERLLSIAQVYMNYVERNESRWQALLAYNQKRSVDILSDQYANQQVSLFRWLGESLAGTSVGEEESSRRLAARMLWSSVHGIMVLNYVGQATPESRQYTWRQVELFVHSFVRGVTV